MKTSLLLVSAASALALYAAGCASDHGLGPYAEQTPQSPALENSEEFVLLDPGAQHSVTCSMRSSRVLPDGRLEVAASLRNLENRRIEVQADCVFKDISGVPTGDQAPFQAVILTENAQEQVQFTSMNDRAKKFTIRVRQAR